MTISAGNRFRALVHNGRPDDTIGISGVAIRNGSYDNPYTYLAGGGCIFSSGNVELFYANVASCYTSAANAVATGGAIFAKGKVTLLASSVTGSMATGLLNKKYATARGGGIFANAVELNASIVSGNTAASPTSPTYGGGVSPVTSAALDDLRQHRTGRAASRDGSFALSNTTISATSRDFDGGAHLAFGTAEIYNNDRVQLSRRGRQHRRHIRRCCLKADRRPQHVGR